MAVLKRRFEAVLERLEGGLGWVVAWLPFDVETTWKQMVRRRVVVEVGGESFRTSLFAPNAQVRGLRKETWFLLVNRKMQQAAGARVGDTVEFVMWPDMEEREAEMPEALAKVVKREKALLKWYATLSESTRREIVKWIEGVESEEAQGRRAEQMAERLLLTMEGERELPPVLELAFRERPAARVGWEKMTATQRRGELMAVFYYRTVEGRARRVEKVVEGCLRVAGRE